MNTKTCLFSIIFVLVTRTMFGNEMTYFIIFTVHIIIKVRDTRLCKYEAFKLPLGFTIVALLCPSWTVLVPRSPSVHYLFIAVGWLAELLSLPAHSCASQPVGEELDNR